jgi:Tfp pilus assembly protein PilN
MIHETSNFASHPFRHYGLYSLGFRMGVVVVLALTALHGLWFYRSTLAREDAREVLGESEARRDALREEVRTRVAQLDVGTIEALNEKVTAANALIDSRRFSWTQLLMDLERVLPARVFVHNISPSIQEEGIKLRLSTISKEPADLVDFLNELEFSPYFSHAYPQNEREDTLQTLGRGIASDVEVLYVPFDPTRDEAQGEYAEAHKPKEGKEEAPEKAEARHAAPPPGEEPKAEAEKPAKMGPLPPPVKGTGAAPPPEEEPKTEAEKPAEMGPLPPPVKGTGTAPPRSAGPKAEQGQKEKTQP